MLKECLRRHKKILLRYCETESCVSDADAISALCVVTSCVRLNGETARHSYLRPLISHIEPEHSSRIHSHESEHHRKVSSRRTN